MATVTGPVKQSPSAKYDAIVEGQLERARKRIRTLDLMTALLGFVAGTLAYGAVMALLDNALTLPPAALYAGFFVYLTAALAYLGVTVVRPLTQHINPYFAARQVEQTLPGAKNSVVNWLDLHDEELPPAVQSALSQKAAKDLAKADLEKAVSGRRAGWAGGIVAGLVFVLMVLTFSLGGGKLFKHLGRAFLPFNGAAPPTKTQLVLLEPPDGDVTVAVNEPVTIRVRVDGQVPESLKLLTRPTESDPEQERWLDPDGRNDWSITVPAFEVKQGFFYRIVGGDASTDVYRVDVRSTPLIILDRFTAIYHQRPYIGNPVDRVQRGTRELKDFRGTDVTLYVPTNRKIKEGQLDLFAKDGQHFTYKATSVAGDEKAMRIAFRLEHSGHYSIRFTSAENDRLPEYTDPTQRDVTAVEDRPPDVRLDKPGKDESLPADAILSLEGSATDDIGVKELTLRMKLNDKAIESRPYRSDEKIKLKLPDGGYAGYPHVLEYKASLDLAALKDRQAKPIVLKTGQVLEYWLEARDACDFPKQNIAESTHYKVTIEEPRRDEKAKDEERRQADADQKEHEKKQNEKLKQENADRQKKQEEQKQANEGQQNEGKKGDPGKDDQGGKRSEKRNDTDKKPGTEQDGAKGKDGEQKRRGQGDKGKEPDDKQSPEQKKKEEEAKKHFDKLKDQAEKQEREERRGGTGKGEEEKERGSAKPDQPQDDKKNSERGKDKSGKESSKGEGKDSPERKPQDRQDKAKEGGKEGNAQNSGESKSRPEKGDKPQAESKDNAAKQGEKQAEGKNDGRRPEQKQDGPGAAKDSDQQNKPKDGEAKAKGGEKQNKPDKKDGKDKGDGKQAGHEATSKDGGDKQQDAKQSQAKDGQQAPKHGEGKGSDQRNAKEKAGQEKDAGGSPMAGQGERSQAKSPPKPEDNKGQQTGAKGEPQQGPRGQAKQGTRESGSSKDQPSAGDAKPAPKQGDPQAADKSARGEEKPAGQGGEKPKDASAPKGDHVQGDALKKPADELRRDDVEDVAKDLRSDDPQKRDQARNKLEDVHRQTQDGEARQAAADALKKDDERRQDEEKASTKSAPKPSQQPDRKDGKQGEQSAESKGGEQKDGGKPGAGKDGGTKQDAAKQGDAKGGEPKADGDKSNVAKHGDDDKEPPSEKGLKQWLDKAAKGMQKKDGDPKPSEKQVAEQLAKTIQDLQSNDPKRREQAKAFLKDLARNAKAKKDGGDKEPKGPPQKPVPENLKKELEKLAKDLKSDDSKRRKQAEDTLKELSKFGRGDKYTGATAKQTERPGAVPEANPSDGRHRNRAGELQLEKLDPKKLRKLIKDAGLTEEQAREAIEYQRKQDATKADPSKATPGSGKALPTTDPTRFKTGDGKTPNVDSTNDGLPPVEYRPAVEDLAKRLSEFQKGSKDK